MSVVGKIGTEALRRLVKWGPEVVASADDISKFGPQAGRVRQLLDFLPTMSDEAARVSDNANLTGSVDAWAKARVSARNASKPYTSNAAEHAQKAALSRGAYHEAAIGTAVNDLIPPEFYRTLTNPLAAGRAVDLLRNRTRYQGTPFLDVVQDLSELGAIANPRDVVRAGRLAQQEDPVRKIAMMLVDEGEPLDVAIKTARAIVGS